MRSWSGLSLFCYQGQCRCFWLWSNGCLCLCQCSWPVVHGTNKSHADTPSLGSCFELCWYPMAVQRCLYPPLCFVALLLSWAVLESLITWCVGGKLVLRAWVQEGENCQASQLSYQQSPDKTGQLKNLPYLGNSRVNERTGPPQRRL